MILIRKQDRIDYILSGVARYYGIKIDDLMRYARNPEKMKRKRIAMKLLYEVADCRHGDIGMALGGTSGAAIWQSLDIINDDLAVDKKLQKEYSDVCKFMEI